MGAKVRILQIKRLLGQNIVLKLGGEKSWAKIWGWAMGTRVSGRHLIKRKDIRQS